jgi:predicted ATPase
MQFPAIYVFTDRFALSEDLPENLREEHLRGRQNALTEAFMDLLNRQALSDFLRASKMKRIDELRDDLQTKLNALCARINEDVSAGAADELIRIFVDRQQYVRIILHSDGKESHYQHLSDNTKFLIAYHIFQEQRERQEELTSILLFDEPDRGFHSSAQHKLLRFLESLADDGNQVFITTHSQHMIDLDRLAAVRIMSRAKDDTLQVDNRLYGSSGANRDTLALQPVTDAIGLRYADQLVTQDKVVVTEGYTELLYVRLFARILDHDKPNLAPVTGDGKILTFISFLISQGISFKVTLDSLKIRRKLQAAIPVPDDSFFVVSEHLGSKVRRSVGIEDLFSKEDFEMLLKRCGHAINDKHFASVSNSEYAKSAGIKALVAREAHEDADLNKSNFSEETIDNFDALLSFCASSSWFRA